MLHNTTQENAALQAIIIDICVWTDKLFELHTINKQINRACSVIRRQHTCRKKKRAYELGYQHDYSDNDLNVTLPDYQMQCFRMAHNKLTKKNNKDACLKFIEHLGDIAVGETTVGNVDALKYLISNMAAAKDSMLTWMPEWGNACDTPQGINETATKVINLVMEGVMSMRSAQQFLALLEKKISFIETSDIFHDVQELKRIVSYHPTQPTKTAG